MTSIRLGADESLSERVEQKIKPKCLISPQFGMKNEQEFYTYRYPPPVPAVTTKAGRWRW